MPADELQRREGPPQGQPDAEPGEHVQPHVATGAEEIYFGRHFTLDELLAGIERVTADDVMRVASDLFRDGAAVATIVGPERGRRAVDRAAEGLRRA